MAQPVRSVLFDKKQPQGNYYGGGGGGSAGSSGAADGGDGLQFYSTNYNDPSYMTTSSYYAPAPGAAGDAANMHFEQPRSFWSAFGTGGIPDEPPLLEELGINFSHIQAKSLTVLNPFKKVSDTIMDDADLAGPLLFIFLFGIFLMLSGKVHFGYIYGVGLLGVVSIYLILNLMAESGMDWSRTASVLGYCMLPLVLLSGFSVVLNLGGLIGLVLSVISIFWCTWSSSAMFTTVLHMNDQRLLVGYPVGLFYACFALMTVF